jgi:hypothetical protein
MTSITTTVRTHRRGVAVIGTLAALVLAAVALLLFKDRPGARHAPPLGHRLPPPAAVRASGPRRRTLRVLSRVTWACRAAVGQ